MNTTTTTQATAATKAPAISAAIAGETLTITGDNGRMIVVNAAELADDIRAAALMHGLKQKLIDAAAISRNPDTGRSATTTDKMDAISEIATRLYAGEWNKRRESGTGGANGGLLLMALVKMYEGRRTADDIRAYLAGLSDAEQAKMRAVPKVAAIIAEIKAAREAKKADASGIDGDALLAGLGDAPF